uniref:Uncharacterized protein n=1 Tax=Anguilla anguilla TaxID=7936 RepID=A0A0E9XPN2_ANGAN
MPVSTGVSLEAFSFWINLNKQKSAQMRVRPTEIRTRRTG